jgi:hypothetical protein
VKGGKQPTGGIKGLYDPGLVILLGSLQLDLRVTDLTGTHGTMQSNGPWLSAGAKQATALAGSNRACNGRANGHSGSEDFTGREVTVGY